MTDCLWEITKQIGQDLSGHSIIFIFIHIFNSVHGLTIKGMYASDLSGMSDQDSDASEGDEDKAGEIPDYALPKDEVDGDADEEEEDEEEEDEADEEEELSSGSELDEEDLAALLDEEPEKENKFTRKLKSCSCKLTFPAYECGTCPGKMLLSLKDEESHLQSKVCLIGANLG